MSEQVLVQVRVDKTLKEEVSEIYETLGMDLPTAIRMFFTRSKMVRGIPFETKLPDTVMTRTQEAAFRVFIEKMKAAEQSVQEQGYYSEEDVEKELAQI
ncbi:MAG: type II toxin-antitoxin system RelB/DinJ family antitoxin [Clostridiales bacterium]|nr:type II toxin-antitoxin system RelB/DinJ family antitoxin [Clostridiales bacterium]